MNRKLRNTILAFSVTGTVLALGLMAARPVEHAGGLQQPAIAAASVIDAIDAIDALDAAHGPDDAGPHAEAPLADEALAREIEERVEARARQFEEEIGRAPSLESAAAMTAGLIAATTAEAVAIRLLSGETAGEAGISAGDEPEAAPRKRRGSVRRAVAVPYFSFARAGHGGRS